MAIRAVIFDIGGVFFPAPDPGLFAGWDAALLWHGPDVEAANVGEISAEEYARRCAGRIGESPERILALIESAYAPDPVNAELVEYARGLRRHHRVAALTNNWSFAAALLSRRGLGDLFELVVNSAEVGVCKPDPRIYALTLERLAVAPAEAVFVDDMLPNVEAARAAGMHAVHFHSAPQAISELDRLLAAGA